MNTTDITNATTNDSADISSETPTTSGLSRRGMLLTLAAAAGGAAAGTGLLASQTHAAASRPRTTTGIRPEAVSAPIAGLTYIAIDAQQMWPTVASTRIYQDLTGTQGPQNDRIWAGLQLPVGSIIKQISVGYQTQPILEISRRPITPAIPAHQPEQVYQKTLQASPGQGFSSTENIPDVVIEAGYSYILSFWLGVGSSVFNASIGYLPPVAPSAQAFFPFSGPTPRVLDTRLAGPLSGKLQPDEERIVDLGITGARTAVINLTVTETVGSGYVSTFQNGITWPGNSTVNWSATNSDVANTAIVSMDPTGKIKIRGGANATHVVIDRVGWFL